MVLQQSKDPLEVGKDINIRVRINQNFFLYNLLIQVDFSATMTQTFET